ncbi:Uu.00g114270.m01.CDS01 [Anthostomella pinea]|uniref:Uu.00g114270.m01.CDS01 n=1 Tax=Anthostomella pinea TaxID=933095 RepID=A0AAI8YE77_9PEZI|nr:Uu.00g114270.m01.CDS01 [Anthostomella pinea]
MSQPRRCFVEEVAGPIKLIDILHRDGATSRRQWSTADEIEVHLNSADCDKYSHRFASICQRTSWSPLQITQPLLELLVSKHDAHDSFRDITSCFYYRNDDVEENYCQPVTINRTGTTTEISYTIRYPELKSGGREWALRQSGLYHSFDTATAKSVSVLFSCTPNSAAHQKAKELLLAGGDDAPAKLRNPSWIHEVLFAAYYPAWRPYIASLELKLLPIEPLRVGYDNLSALVSLENRFLQIPQFLSHGEDVLRELVSVFGQDRAAAGVGPLPTAAVVLQLENYRRRAQACSRTATSLHRRSQTTAQLLSDTLSFGDQIVAKEQNGSMLQLNKSAVFLTTLTLFYLPASFVATFFGMNFFDLDQQVGRIVSTPTIWIYIVTSIALTAMTFSVYYWVLHHDDSVVRRMSPKVHIVDWRGLTRRLTMKGGNRMKFESAPV